MTASERAIKFMQKAENEQEVNRAWFLMAQSAIWALVAIAVELESLPKER
jgi:hypothetical protein